MLKCRSSAGLQPCTAVGAGRLFRLRTLFALFLFVVAAAPALAQTAPPAGQRPAGQTRPPAPAAPIPLPAVPQSTPPVRPLGPMATDTTVCDLTIPKPAKLPPAGSGPVVYLVVPCFRKQGGTSMIEPQTYLYYIQLQRSQPSQDKWVPYNDDTEQTMLGDFKRLWATNFLDDLDVDVEDYHFANGVIGKMVVYDMEERQRVKIVDYVGSKKVEQSKIDDELKKKGMQIRLDSFIDPSLVRNVAGVVRDMYAEKGYEYAEVKPEIKPASGGPKIVNLTFHIIEGPQVKIADVDFLGNSAISDGALAHKMKDNKGPNKWLLFLSNGGTYKESKFEDDADKVQSYYREKGYVKAQVGQPQLKILEDSKDGRTRYVQLQIPVTEGPRYKIGDVSFSGNTVIKTEGLRPLFKVEAGEWFNEKKIRKGFDKARDVYGSAGYFEFTGVPEFSFPDDAKPAGAAGSGPAAAASTDAAPAGPPPPGGSKLAVAAAAAPPPVARPHQNPFRGLVAWMPFFDHQDPAKAPRVNVTMRLEEGKQYFVNRIIFVGNTTTRDNVIRREVRLYENGIFNTEALKYSVKRLNQLGYFKPLEGEAIDVQKSTVKENTVDVRLKFQEQNRNQITFGAGVSQYEGFFGQLAFQTSNFMGRGETFSVSAQQGNLAKDYQAGFTEPFLFDRPITAGINVFDQEIQYINQFTQDSAGVTSVWGFPAGPFSRWFLSYGYQAVRVKDLNPLYFQAASANVASDPFLADSLLLNQGGQRRISKVGPSYVYNTVDNPIFPTTGKKYSLGLDVAGSVLGGNVNFTDMKADGVWYFQQTKKTSIGLHTSFEYIRPYGNTTDLPIFEKLFLGGEYSIRGYDLRSIGPRDPGTGLVIGGNKSLLFNAEYLISIAGPVRLVLFYDAGEVRDVGEAFTWKEQLKQLTNINQLTPADAASALFQVSGFNLALKQRTDILGETSAFKTSTGAEIRFFMPVLNVPFRLIFAMNPQRGGVLDNNLLPEKAFKFRFAVGTTF